MHEPDDPPGFDLRQVGGSVFWTHALSPDIQADSLSVVLEIAVVGLIDQNYGSIDNRLFLNGTEVPGAFDNSHDGWNLYRFVPDPDLLLGDTLEVELRADPSEGWGGVDFSRLVLSPTVPPALQITPGLVLQFDTHPCGQYQVMRSVDRVQWEPFGPPIAGDGGTATVQLASTQDEAWMFRVMLVSDEDPS